MKKNILLLLPLIAMTAIEVLAFVWAGQTWSMVTVLSGTVAALMVLTGLLPAIIKPQTSHTLVACFTIVFGFFLLCPC